MKHAQLQVGLPTFMKWINSKERIAPLLIKIEGAWYFVRFHLERATSVFNAKIIFIGVHEDKDHFEQEFVDELPDIAYPNFPEDEYLGQLEVIEADNSNIDLYFYLNNLFFENHIDTLLRETPKSWNLEIFTDKAIKEELPVEKPIVHLSLDELILALWKKNLAVPVIIRELQKYNHFYSEKTIRNRLTELRKQLGVERVPLRRPSQKTKD